MNVIIGSADRYLGTNLSRIVTGVGLKNIRTNSIERLIKEMKRPDKVLVVDINWEELQERGVLRQIVNIAKISGNTVIAICPNQDEDLKKLAKACRVDQAFIRYDLEVAFKDFLKGL